MDLERLDTVDTSETRYFKKLRPSPVSLVSPVLSSFYTRGAANYQVKKKGAGKLIYSEVKTVRRGQ